MMLQSRRERQTYHFLDPVYQNLLHPVKKDWCIRSRWGLELAKGLYFIVNLDSDWTIIGETFWIYVNMYTKNKQLFHLIVNKFKFVFDIFSVLYL